VEEAEEKLC